METLTDDLSGSQRGVGRAKPDLSPRGRFVRLAITLVGAAILMYGTVWGSDDLFPFGPFRMFAGVNGPNENAPDPRLDGVDSTGARIVLTERLTGIRRAEIEEQRQRFVDDPSLLAGIAEAYRARNPDAPRLVEVRLVMRWHLIRDSRPTGEHRDDVLAVWRAP